MLLARRRESLGKMPPPGWRPWVFALGASALAGLAVAWSDARLADSARLASEQIRLQFGQAGRSVWFQGHWGFQWYMQAWDAKPVDYCRSALLKGDILIIPAQGSNLDAPPSAASGIRTLTFDSCRGLTPLSIEAGAGFYSAQISPLPFAWLGAQAETYRAYEVTQSFAYQGLPKGR